MKSAITRLTSPYVASPLPSHVLRVGVGVMLLYTQLMTVPYLFDLYSVHHGIVQAGAIGGLTYLPTAQDLVDWLSPIASERVSLPLLFAANVAATLAMTLGLWPRASGVLTWVLTSLFFFAGHAHAYGVDFFRQTYLFLLVVLAVTTPRRRGLAPPPAPPLVVYRWLQLFLCIVYCTSGLSKAFPEILVDPAIVSNRQWFDGSAIYRALLRPDLGRFDFTWLPRRAAIAVCWGTLLLEVGFPLLVIFKRTRRLAAVAVCAMHAGIAVAMGLWTFSTTMIVAVTAVYLVPLKRQDLARDVVVVYDGQCTICRRIIGCFAAARGGFLPVGRITSRRLADRLTHELDLEREMYVIEGGGFVRGSEAFMSFLGDTIGIRLAWLGRWSVSQRAYRWFARHRRQFGCSTTCALRAQPTKDNATSF